VKSEKIASLDATPRSLMPEKVKQIATNGINDGIRDTFHRTPDFPTEQKCRLGRRLQKPVKRSRDAKCKGPQVFFPNILSF